MPGNLEYKAQVQADMTGFEFSKVAGTDTAELGRLFLCEAAHLADTA